MSLGVGIWNREVSIDPGFFQNFAIFVITRLFKRGLHEFKSPHEMKGRGNLYITDDKTSSLRFSPGGK